MPKLEELIGRWRRQLAAKGVKNPSVLDELESHLRDEIERLIQSGLELERAFEMAVQSLGQAEELRLEFQKISSFKMLWFRKFKAWLSHIEGTPVREIDENARLTLAFAREEAPKFNHHFVGTEHLLLALLRVEGSKVSQILEKMGVTQHAIREAIEEIVGVGFAETVSTPPPFTPRASKALRLANAEARQLRHSVVGSEHILLGLLREGSGVAALVLEKLGVRLDATREAVLKEINRAY